MPFVEYDGPTQWVHMDGSVCDNVDGVSQEVPGHGLCYDHDQRVKRVPAPQSNIRLEILHHRDPDSSCEHVIFLNGVRLDWSQVDLEDVDPGAGYEKADWKERIKDAKKADYRTPEFRQLVVDALKANKNSKYNLD